MPAPDLNTLLRQTNELRASDLHLRVGIPPRVRVHGNMRTLEGYEPLTGEQLKDMMMAGCTEDQVKKFAADWQLDFSYKVPGVARFRVNYFRERGTIAAVFRRIPDQIPSLPDLAAPRALLDFSELPRGLVLVTGPTGSGKTTTLAALIDLINVKRSQHILCIEDPVEFVHSHKNCIVSQREIGRDAKSFEEALKSALREDPDVIMVGEMRDLETISIAITAAETGHLVFATLHTSSAAETINRIIDVFPEGQQAQVRTQLADALKGVVCQALLPRADGKGRIAAHEVMIVNHAISASIREGKTASLNTTLQTQSKLGMQSMDKALAWLVYNNLVEEDDARQLAERAQDSQFSTFLQQAQTGTPLQLPGFVTWPDMPVEMRPRVAAPPPPSAASVPAPPAERPTAVEGGFSMQPDEQV